MLHCCNLVTFMELATFEYSKSLTELINDVTLKHVTIDWFTVAVNYFLSDRQKVYLFSGINV